MKVIVTTSNRYVHLLPVFCHLFNTFWGKDQQVEIVGYKTPTCELPDNFTFVSLGEQIGGPENFSTDLRAYFELQDQYVIWCMEDSFFKAPVNHRNIRLATQLAIDGMGDPIGRIGLTNDNYKQYDELYGVVDYVNIYKTPQKSEYRLSTQPAIWNRDYLLRYMTPGLNPWQFECQEKVEDEFLNLCLEKNEAPIVFNEGVRKWDLYALNLEGIPEEVINEMKELEIL